jgi:plastocyanin
VKPEGTDIPSAEETNRAARAELEEFSKPFLKMYDDARDGTFESEGGEIRGPFAGLGSNAVEGSINEFLPRTINTEVGRRVTWKLLGSDHTISFDVPKYFPIIRFAENGNISLNPRLDKPAGGSPPIPEEREDQEGPIRVDGGTYDGSGFFSSGLFGSDPYAEYSLRFSKPGRYRYACLIHPPMVGTVVVTP